MAGSMAYNRASSASSAGVHGRGMRSMFLLNLLDPTLGLYILSRT